MENQHYFGQVFQYIPAPSLVLLPDAPKFTIIAANDAYLKTVNSTEEELIGKGVFEAFPENPEDRISKGVENLRNSLEFVHDFKEKHKMHPQKYDIPIRGTSGFTSMFFNPQNIPLLDDDGNITYILHTVEDITDKKLLESSLEIERKRFNDLYFQAPSCMGILSGPDHVYELANPLYLELIGEKDIIGKTVKEILPELEAQGILNILDNVFETGEPFSANEMLVKFNHYGNGELVDRYLDFNYQANRNTEGVIEGILFFATDVTELVLSRKKIEESELRYKELIQNLPIATVSSDFEGRILLYNKAAVDLWGREPEIEKDKWCGSYKIYSKDGNLLPDEISPMAVAIKEGGKTTAQEIIVERPNGTKVNVLINPVPYKDSSGKVIGIVNMGIDITESKRTNERLQTINKELANQIEDRERQAAELFHSNRELIKTNKELDRFVYSVSHDLRSPLTSILGLVSFIEEDTSEPDTLEHIKMIRSSINRLDGFIKNILVYSKNSRTGLDAQKIPIKKTINEIVDSVRRMKEANGISFKIDIDEEHSFYSDWHRFNTVLENLVSNAVKHHAKEVPGRYLKLTGTSEKEEFKLSISDNGVGIDPEYHEKIFEMFYRLPGNTEGSGLGLYIVKETLEKMQGTIEIESQKGVGTSFNIRLKNLKR